MTQLETKAKIVGRMLRFLLLLSLILWALQPMGALGETLSDFHVTLVYHENLPEGSAYAGEIFLTGDGNLYSTYCIDLDVETYLNVIYSRGSDLNNEKIAYILNNYYPVVADKPSELGSTRDAAVQLAIWHYSDNLNIASGGSDPAIFDAARNIIADTENNYQKTYSLTFDDSLPAGCVGSETTIRAKLTLGGSPVEGKSVSFIVTGSNTATGLATTDGTGYATFEYTPIVAGTDVITATVQDIIPAGLYWISQEGHQTLVSAKKNPLSSTKSISVNLAPVISAEGDTVCVGEDAQLIGTVTTNNCEAGTLTYQWYRVDGSTETPLEDGDGSKYAGTSTLIFSIKNAGASDIGIYRLKVTCPDTPCAGVSDAVLSVNLGASVVSATGATVYPGETALLIGSVLSSNCDGTLTYQWYRVEGSTETPLEDGDGSKYAGTSTLIFSIKNAGTSDIGTYRLKVTCPDTPCASVADAVLSINGFGSITVVKDAIPNDGTLYSTQHFAFVSDTLGSFTLADDGSGQSEGITFDNIEPGDYQIVEQPQSGWLLSFIDCVGAESKDLPDGNDGKIIHLGAGESATITFVNTQSSSFDPSIGFLEINKTALNTSVYRGEDINYIIKVCNKGPVPLTNVNVVDILPQGVELWSTSPEPTTGLSWHVGTLEPGECFEIALTVKVPVTDFHYDMSQGVSGKGFVNVYNNYDTTVNPSFINNCAYATYTIEDGIVGKVSDCASTNILEEPGTQLKRREFGSGIYESEELTRIRTENKSIKTVTSLSAVHQPTTFALPQGRSMNYGTKWTEKSKAINTITGATMNEEYTHANNIDKDRSVEIDKNGTTMKSEVVIRGRGPYRRSQEGERRCSSGNRSAYEAQ